MSDAPEAAPAPAENHVGAAAGKGTGKGSAGGAAAKPKMIILIAMIAGPLLLGGAGGAFLLGPKLTGATAAHASDKHAKKKKKDAKEGEGAKSPIFKIDNLIVNPAGSQGSHFLMAQIAIECEDDKQVALLKANEDRVKDMIITAISQQTLEQLTEPGARDSIKVHILAAVNGMLYHRATEAGADPSTDDDPADHRALQVFLPQFVIQ